MAQATTTRFGKFLIKLGDDSDPIVYTSPCGFTQKSLTLSKELADVLIPDCDDPDAVAWIGRDATSKSASVSGEGVVASESLTTWLNAWESTSSTPVKIEIEFTGGTTTTWTGYMHVSSLNPSAEQGGRVTMAIEMQSDGELTRVTA